MNNSKTKDLTVGNLPKQIILFSLPLMVTNVLQVLFNIADVAVVGRFAGDAALGAVSSAMIIAIFFGGMIMGFGGGINVVVAFHYGTKNCSVGLFWQSSEQDLNFSVERSFICVSYSADCRQERYITSAMQFILQQVIHASRLSFSQCAA